jgi:signal transduction histidine kinase
MTRRKILIVDDDQYVRVLLARMVEPLHHDVQVAEHGQAALDLAIQTPFDLIMTDWKMPVMDGLALIENLRARAIDSAVILLTAHADLERVLEAGRRLNISSFLIKPIHSLEQLHFDIQAAISRRELERENRGLMHSLRDANTRLEERIAERTRELAKTNEELNRISQFRADVLKILGHELQTPLAILQGYLQLAGSATGGESGAYLGQMERSVVRLERIARKAMLLAKPTGNAQFPILTERVDPAALCQAVIDRLKPLVRHRGIRLALAADAPASECWWDAERVEYIVEELLVNAVRATQDGGSIDVRLAGGDGVVTIRVVDEGIGIGESERQRVFEPFVTLGAPEHHSSGQFEFRAQGLGIGLPAARMLAELHAGSLVSAANPSGRGCIFTLSLRQRTESTGAAPEPRPAPFAGAPDTASDGA